MIQVVNGAARDSSLSVNLDLVVTDRESVIELLKHEEVPRTDFALSALKVGVLANRLLCSERSARLNPWLLRTCRQVVELAVR